MEAPADGLNDAPVAFRRSLKRHLLNAEASLKCLSPRCQASTLDLCLFFVFRTAGSSVGAPTTHIDDIFGRGESDVLAEMRSFLVRHFGELK